MWAIVHSVPILDTHFRPLENMENLKNKIKDCDIMHLYARIHIFTKYNEKI